MNTFHFPDGFTDMFPPFTREVWALLPFPYRVVPSNLFARSLKLTTSMAPDKTYSYVLLITTPQNVFRENSFLDNDGVWQQERPGNFYKAVGDVSLESE